MLTKIIYATLLTVINLPILAKEYVTREPARSRVQTFFAQYDARLLALKRGTLLQYIFTNIKMIRKAVYYSLFHVIAGCLSCLIWDVQYGVTWSLLGVAGVLCLERRMVLPALHEKKILLWEIMFAPGVKEGYLLIGIGLPWGYFGLLDVPLKPALKAIVFSEYFIPIYLLSAFGWILYAALWFKLLPVVLKLLLGVPLYILKIFFSTIFNYINEKLTLVTLVLIDFILAIAGIFLF